MGHSSVSWSHKTERQGEGLLSCKTSLADDTSVSDFTRTSLTNRTRSLVRQYVGVKKCTLYIGLPLARE